MKNNKQLDIVLIILHDNDDNYFIEAANDCALKHLHLENCDQFPISLKISQSLIKKNEIKKLTLKINDRDNNFKNSEIIAEHVKVTFLNAKDDNLGKKFQLSYYLTNKKNDDFFNHRKTIHDIYNALIELTFGIELLSLENNNLNKDITKPMNDSLNLIQKNIDLLKENYEKIK